MKTVKSKGKNAAKRASGRTGRKAKDAAELREQIEILVKRRAINLVETAIGEADKGHFAAMKYLFEMIGLYPGPEEAEPQAEDSLARTLLRRLREPRDLAIEPALSDEAAAGRPTRDALE
jgi:hypothetical protein